MIPARIYTRKKFTKIKLIELFLHGKCNDFSSQQLAILPFRWANEINCLYRQAILIRSLLFSVQGLAIRSTFSVITQQQSVKWLLWSFFNSSFVMPDDISKCVLRLCIYLLYIIRFTALSLILNDVSLLTLLPSNHLPLFFFALSLSLSISLDLSISLIFLFPRCFA